VATEADWEAAPVGATAVAASVVDLVEVDRAAASVDGPAAAPPEVDGRAAAEPAEATAVAATAVASAAATAALAGAAAQAGSAVAAAREAAAVVRAGCSGSPQTRRRRPR